MTYIITCFLLTCTKCSNKVLYGVNRVFAPLIESLSSVLCVNLALSLWIKSSVRFSVGPLAVWMWQVHKFCDGEKKRDVCHERCKLRDVERGQTDLWTLCVCERENDERFVFFLRVWIRDRRLTFSQTSSIKSDRFFCPRNAHLDWSLTNYSWHLCTLILIKRHKDSQSNLSFWCWWFCECVCVVGMNTAVHLTCIKDKTYFILLTVWCLPIKIIACLLLKLFVNAQHEDTWSFFCNILCHV